MKNFQILKYLESLKNNLYQIRNYLNPRNKYSLNFTKDPCHHQTWSLVIGPDKSGKTSLFQKTDVFLLPCQEANSTPCNTWYNNQAVFIEVPYVTNPAQVSAEIFQTMKQFGRKRGLDRILLVLDIYDFMTNTQRVNDYCQKWVSYLHHLLEKQVTHHIDIYITFTHLDRVAGFNEYFALLSDEQRQQAWGYLLDDYTCIEMMLEQHHEKYTELLRNMYSQLLNLLHINTISARNYLIREFPLQLESLQHSIHTLLTHIAKAQPSRYKVNGVFFTSARQNGSCHDGISVPISKMYHLVLSSEFSQLPCEQVYFIDGLLNLMIDTPCKTKQRIPVWIKKVGGTLATLFSVVFIVGIAVTYWHSTTTLKKVGDELGEFTQLHNKINLKSSQALKNLIPSLHYLELARNELATPHPYWLWFNNFASIKQQINTTYQSTVRQDFLTFIAHQMEAELINAKNPSQKYTILKAYLMLGKTHHLQVKWLKRWLDNNHQSNIKLQELTLNKQFLKISLARPFQGIKLNAHLIKYVRNDLNQIPLHYLIYKTIKDKVADDIEPKSDSNIPAIYLRSHYYAFIAQTIPAQVSQFQQEQWVLGKSEASFVADQQLIEEVTQLYTSEYNNWWQRFTTKLHPPQFQNIDEARDYFKQMTKTPIPLEAELMLVQQNTRTFETPNKLQKLFNQDIAAHFTQINSISLESFNDFIPVLSQLNRVFNDISMNPKPQEACFNLAKSIFSNSQDNPITHLIGMTKNSTTTLNAWMSAIAVNSLTLILHQTQDYINQQWAAVSIEYKNHIAQRFPIRPDAGSEISLEDFNHFFANDGSLQQFFANYLQPFLNIEEAQWVPKQIEGIQFPLTQEMITDFERANVVRQMFYANKHSNPQIIFAIQAIGYEPNISSANLNINGQNLAGGQNMTKIANFKWPGKQSFPASSLTFHMMNGKQYHITQSGPWGLFRLLTQATISSSGNDNQHFNVTFAINGITAKYLFTTFTPLNPFNMNIIQQFSLPDKIV